MLISYLRDQKSKKIGVHFAEICGIIGCVGGYIHHGTTTARIKAMAVFACFADYRPIVCVALYGMQFVDHICPSTKTPIQGV